LTQNRAELPATIIHQRKVEVTSSRSDAARLSYKFPQLHEADYEINSSNVLVEICTAEPLPGCKIKGPYGRGQ
jgi:hypothetical protein